MHSIACVDMCICTDIRHPKGLSVLIGVYNFQDTLYIYTYMEDGFVERLWLPANDHHLRKRAQVMEGTHGLTTQRAEGGERGRQTDRQRGRATERHTETERDRLTERETERDREGERGREAERQRHRQRNRDRERDREAETERMQQMR